MNLTIIPGFILGTILGSLSLALADRSLSNKSFLGRSFCPKCKVKLRWYDLFPILSFISLKGRCRYCHQKISLDYLLVEVIMGLLIGYLFFQSFNNFTLPTSIIQFPTSHLPLLDFQLIKFIFDLIFKIFFITVLAVITVTDLRQTLIPDRVMFPAIIISTVALFIFTIYRIWYLYFYLSLTLLGRFLLPPHSDYFQRHALLATEPLFGALLSALALAGFFLALIIITRGRGMGGGDVKLGVFMGLGLGFPNSVLALILSFFTGAVAALGLLVGRKKSFGQYIPFGPFLVIGSLIALFWGEQIISWYIRLFG